MGKCADQESGDWALGICLKALDHLRHKPNNELRGAAMPRIVLVRPCESLEQENGKLVGRTDVELTPEGHAQARALASYLESWPIGMVAVSPMRRALSTAMYLCEENNRVPRLVNGFLATDLGEWEGKTRHWVIDQDGGRFERFRSEPDFPCPGGESLRNIYRRSFSELVNLVAETDAREILLIIAPAMVLRVLACGILDLPLTHAMSFALHHGSVSTFTRLHPGGPYQLSRWNDTSYQFQPLPAWGLAPSEMP
jgi:broad specificity phosphatase PhoE